jgi:chemotaxis protein CheX
VDVSYINPFIIATDNCFKKMMNLTVTAEPPQLKRYPYPGYDISAVIGLSGEAQGSISLSFSKDTATEFVKKMLGDVTSISEDDMIDGVGEIVNIIAGNAKAYLTKFNLSISLPNVIIGNSHTLAGQSGSPTIVVPFSCQTNTFIMEVSLKTK